MSREQVNMGYQWLLAGKNIQFQHLQKLHIIVRPNLNPGKHGKVINPAKHNTGTSYNIFRKTIEIQSTPPLLNTSY